MTLEEVITPANLVWPPVVYTFLVSMYTVLSRSFKGLDMPLHPGYVLRIFIQGVVLEAIVVAVIFFNPDLLPA